MEKILSNGDKFELRDMGDGTYHIYSNGRSIGWGSWLTQEETNALEEMENKYILGCDPYKRSDG